MNTGLDQYMDIFKDAVEDSAAKLTKSFEKILIEVIILFMVIPRKINFTQMGRYGSHVEQTYRNAFGLKKSKSIDWLKLNVSLAKRFFGKHSQADDAELLSFELAAGKMLFLLLGPFSKVLAILFTLDPGDTADDISRSQEQACQTPALLRRWHWLPGC